GGEVAGKGGARGARARHRAAEGGRRVAERGSKLDLGLDLPHDRRVGVPAVGTGASRPARTRIRPSGRYLALSGAVLSRATRPGTRMSSAVLRRRATTSGLSGAALAGAVRSRAARPGTRLGHTAPCRPAP